MFEHSFSGPTGEKKEKEGKKQGEPGSGDGAGGRMLKAMVVGAALVTGHPAQAEDIPGVPSHESVKKTERKETRPVTTPIGHAMHPEFGQVSIEIFQGKTSDGSLDKATTVVKINGQERKVAGAFQFRAVGGPGTCYMFEGGRTGVLEQLLLHGGGDRYVTTDSAGNKLELKITP